MEMNTVKNNINANLSAQQLQRVQEAQEAQRPLDEKPVEGAAQGEFYQEPDQYSPRQAQPPSGLYWVEPGENGPRIRQDGATPAQEDQDPEKPEKEEPKESVERTTTDTDEVDREIKRAKEKASQLQQQVDHAPEGPERDRLEKQLRQAENEVQLKDNDTYRRQHAKISFG